jgi:hypothetical protein
MDSNHLKLIGLTMELRQSAEVKRLQKLSHGMSRAIRSQEINRLQQYEELLAEYKQLLAHFVRHTSRVYDIDERDVRDKIDMVVREQNLQEKGQ